MKKVVMLNSMSFLPHQGRYIRIYNEAKTLVDNGYKVTLITWDREAKHRKNEVKDGIKIERIWVKAGVEKGPLLNGVKVIWFNVRAFFKILFMDFDIVHCFNLDTIPVGYVIARLKKKKSVLDLCEPNYYAFWKGVFSPFVKIINWMEKKISMRFDYVLVHNLYQVKKFKGYGFKHLEQIGTFPNSNNIINEVEQKETTYNGEIVIGRIGTIYADNGIEETIEAFKILLKDNKKARLFFAGRVYENYLSTFKSIIEPLGDRVEIIGSFTPEQMPELYKKINVSVIVNRTSSNWFKHITPAKLFDSLANGVPVIASDIGDMKTILEANNCGIIVDETKPEDMADAFSKLATDSNLRFKMAQNGLNLIKEEYNWDIMAERLVGIYGKL